MVNNSFYSVLERLFASGIKFMTVIFLGHVLGAKGQGVYSLYLAVWALISMFSSLGMGISNNYFGARESSPEAVSALLGNTLVFGILSGILAAGLTWAIAVTTDIFRAFPSGYLGILLVGVIVHAVNAPLLGLLLGLNGFKVRMYSTLLNFGSYLVILVTERIFGVLTDATLGRDWLITLMVAMIIWGVYCWRQGNYRITFRWVLLKQQVAHGWNSFKYFVTSAALVRVDSLIVSYLLGVAAAGIYSVAVYFAEILMYFPNALTTVMLTAVGGGKQLPRRFYQSISTLFLIAILATALIIPLAVTILFPAQYHSAIYLSEMMLLGVYWLGMGSLGAFHDLGTGNFRKPFVASLVAVTLEVAMDFLLIPYIGLIGAAIADTLAYILFGVFVLYSIGKVYQQSIFQLLLPINPINLIRDLKTSYAQRKP